jgi:ribosomal protein S18 acetylase RimI-like enzyme
MSDPAPQPLAAILRPGKLSDLDALVAIEAEAFTTDLISRRSLRRFLASPSAALLVAEVAGRVAGYALVLFRSGNTSARLYSIAVSRASAGQGIGPALLEKAEAAARGRGATRMRLEVEEGNARAISRYQKAGYRLFGRRDSYYESGGHALLFDKPLLLAS